MAAPTRTPRSSWIEEGLRALAAGGPDAVRIEPLAKVLGVTRGGFYWHFDDRRALLEEILDSWERASVDEVIERIENEGGDARAKLRRLSALAASSDEPLRIDLAVRDWARREQAVAQRLRRIDGEWITCARCLVPSAATRMRSRPAAWSSTRCGSATTSSPPITAPAGARTW
jgi:AcrR family transcriptional regulator